MSFSSDTFTDTAGTDLQSHTMSGGGTWTRNTIRSTVPAVITNVNTARFGGSAGAIPLYYASETPPSANQKVAVDFICKSQKSDSLAGICVRLSTTVDTLYYLANYFATPSGSWSINKRLTGSETGLATPYPHTIAVNETAAGIFEVVGDNLAAWVNGRCVLGAIDTGISAVNRTGLTWYSGTTWTDAQGLHIDNYAADDLGTVAKKVGYIGDSQCTTFLTTNLIPPIAGAVCRKHSGLTTQVYNQGVNSSHTGTGADGWAPGAASNYLTNAKTAFASAGVTHVCIMLGTNDCADGIALSATDYETNLDAIRDDLVSAGYKVILHYPPAFNIALSSGDGLGAAAQARIEAYLPKIDGLCDKVNTFQGDRQLYSYLLRNLGELHTDGYHLSTVGKASAGQFHGAAIAAAGPRFLLMGP